MDRFVKGLVKTVFILCYIAFMAASIRHVAVFFNGFEPNNDNVFGSYALAGAFDITALVSTIGVMFFRKSMPTWVFVIVWIFIGAIAAYSYVINLEYTSHYQDVSMLMQPTGQLTPVLDAHGNVHYEPVMKLNTTLEWINPFLASGFTIFALVYSVIAEFFGTKAPTVDELRAQKQYLEDTVTLHADIEALKKQNKKPGVVERVTNTAKDVVKAGQEIAQAVSKKNDKAAFNDPDTEPLTSSSENVEDTIEADLEEDFDTGEREALQRSLHEVSKAVSEVPNAPLPTGLEDGLDAAFNELEKHYPKIVAWRSLRAKSVTLKAISEVTGKHHKTVQSAALKGTLERINRYPDRVLLTSVLTWLLREVSETSKTAFEETTETPVIETINDPLPRLGMIEDRMLEAVLDAPASERRKLQEYADSHTLAEITSYLKQQYSQYASYITEARVENVMKVYQAKHRVEPLTV